MTIELRNESGLEFTDISSESERWYSFPDGSCERIQNPQWLNVSASGGHRILDVHEVAHYIPAGWHHLCWTVGPLSPHFVK